MFKALRLLLISVICVLAATIVIAHRKQPYIEPEAVAAQDVMSLDRRISSLEQRLFSIESSISQLQQQITLSRSSPASPNVGDSEVYRLRSEIQLLQQRIKEVECGVVKLDERTLPTGARDSRRTERRGADPCRAQPETPVRISARPY